MPAILVACLVAGLLALNDYGTIVLFGKRSLAVAIHNFWHDFDRPAFAAQLAGVVIAAVLLLLAGVGWYASRKSYYDPIVPKEGGSRVRVCGARGVFAFIVCGLPVALGFLLPLGMLLSWAVPRIDKVDLNRLLSYTQNSLSVSILTTAVCLVLGLFFVLNDFGRPSSHGRRLLLLTLNAGYFIPSIALSVGVLSLLSWSRGWLVSPLLSHSIFALVYAMSVRFFCLPFLVISIGRKKMPPRIDDLLLSLQRPFTFKIGRLFLPLLKRWILVGALITFISALKELNLSLALAPVNYVSLSTRIYFFSTHEMARKSAVWCLCIVLITLFPVISISRRLTTIDR